MMSDEEFRQRRRAEKSAHWPEDLRWRFDTKIPCAHQIIRWSNPKNREALFSCAKPGHDLCNCRCDNNPVALGGCDDYAPALVCAYCDLNTAPGDDGGLLSCCGLIHSNCADPSLEPQDETGFCDTFYPAAQGLMKRVMNHVAAIGRHLRKHGSYHGYLDEEDLDND